MKQVDGRVVIGSQEGGKGLPLVQTILAPTNDQDVAIVRSGYKGLYPIEAVDGERVDGNRKVRLCKSGSQKAAEE
jgi:hypothetical protein